MSIDRAEKRGSEGSRSGWLASGTAVRQSVIVCITLLSFVPAAWAVFPDAHDPPSAGWTGPVFKLRQDYPATRPAVGAKPWKAFSFRTQPEAYLRAVLAYGLEGNIPVDWQLESNTVRNWYHAPWMHSTSTGREFVHGLTKERSSRPGDLHPNQSSFFQSWAVGIYNAPGGYVIGRVWKDPMAPNPGAARFPDGTVALKLLFTTATVADVPYLQNAFTWQAHIHDGTGTTRSIQTVRLLQVDVAVRDTRAASTTGWVFGTFVYDGNAPGATPWERLVPVGAMWGNDPTVTQDAASTPSPLHQSWINPTIGPPQHLGRAGRLNGPVDNPKSSCLSCHSTAQYKAVSSPVPPANASTTETMRWFRNIRATRPFDTGQVSLGYSLQLAVGIQRFLQANPAALANIPVPAATRRTTRVSTVRREDP